MNNRAAMALASALVIGVGVVIGIALCYGNSGNGGSGSSTTSPTQTGYEAENRVGNWVLSIRVTPENITSDNGITLYSAIKYTGSDNFRVTATRPLAGYISITTTDGTIVWEEFPPQSIWSEFEIMPQHSEGLQWVAPSLSPSMYWVKAEGHGYNPDGSRVDITIELSIEVKP